MSLLEIKDLTVRYNLGGVFRKVINTISFSVETSEMVALVGESGCGKSVTSLAVMGLLDPDRTNVTGEIKLDGKDLVGLSYKELSRIRGNDISMIFQEPMTSLNPVLSIGYQLREVISQHTPLRGRQLKEKALDCLRKVHIPDPERRLNEYPHQLSGGMRQRVMIAMALACSPRLLVADEPTTALDVTSQKEIIRLIRDLRVEVGAAVIFITHDLTLVREIADRVLVMYAGHIVEAATVQDLYEGARHPYTQGLLNAIPRLGGSFESPPFSLKEIPGTVPDISLRNHNGCPFQDRCERRIDICRDFMPALTSVSEGHHVACNNPV